jgi:transposase-like protein
MVPMTATPLVNLAALIDDVTCFALVRQHRWPDGVRCPSCGSAAVARHGRDETHRCRRHRSGPAGIAGASAGEGPHRQRYRCTACGSRFDDLTGTALAGHHRPLRLWVLCLYLMGLNLSNRQIAHELGLSGSDVQAMTEHLRSGLVAKTPAVVLDGTVEVDEVYGVAGHKGHPAAVAKKAAAGGGVGSRAHPVAARWRKRNRQSWG